MDYLVLISRPNSEFLLEDELNLSFAEKDVYLPTYMKSVRVRRSHRYQNVLRPLYGRYLFFGLIEKEQWRKVREMKYLASIICQIDKVDKIKLPIWLPEKRINEVRSFNMEEELKRREMEREAMREMMIGDKVMIAVGPFSGMRGKYVGANKILLSLFGRITTVNVDRALLIRA